MSEALWSTHRARRGKAVMVAGAVLVFEGIETGGYALQRGPVQPEGQVFFIKKC